MIPKNLKEKAHNNTELPYFLRSELLNMEYRYLFTNLKKGG